MMQRGRGYHDFMSVKFWSSTDDKPIPLPLIISVPLRSLPSPHLPDILVQRLVGSALHERSAVHLLLLLLLLLPALSLLLLLWLLLVLLVPLFLLLLLLRLPLPLPLLLGALLLLLGGGSRDQRMLRVDGDVQVPLTAGRREPVHVGVHVADGQLVLRARTARGHVLEAGAAQPHPVLGVGVRLTLAAGALLVGSLHLGGKQDRRSSAVRIGCSMVCERMAKPAELWHQTRQ